MLPDQLIEAVNKMVSGIRAFDYVDSISRFHRIQASPGLHNAIVHLKEEIGKVSKAKTKVFDYAADGRSQIETWTAPFGWTADSGTLELLEPEERLLADFQAEPISLITHSQGADMESEVVYVGKALSPKDLEGKDIKSKVVLTENLARIAAKPLFALGGAAGILTYVPPSGVDEIAHLRRYDAFWPAAGEDKITGFGFSLRQADGLKLKGWLEEGKTVKVRAKVDAKLGTGKTEVLSALIEGEDTSKEFWLFAHICHPHPGANDNASGSAALMEALRTISALLDEGPIEKLECSIRFVWLPEWNGTISFIHNEKVLLERCIGMLNMDMVGADPAKAGSVLHLFRTPYSLPTTLNNIVRYWAETESERKPDRIIGGTMCPLPFSYDIYSAGSDHLMFVDSTVGKPSVMLNQYPDRFYHTSTDTIDKVDPVQMAYATRIAVLSALTHAMPKHVCKELMMTLCRDEAIEIMHRISHSGVCDLSRCRGNPEEIYPRIIRWLGLAHELGLATLDKAGEEWHLISEQKSLQEALKTSLEMTYTTEMVVARKAYEGACAEVGLEAQRDDQISLESLSFGMDIKRRINYPLDPGFIMKKLPDRVPAYMELKEKMKRISETVDEILNLSNEWTSLDSIYDTLCLQFGSFESKILLDIVKDLTTAEVIESRGK
ncbi:MAG: DUF4910 domain-containing protein [Candidatus Thorarchaeota archaeon]|nr:MAG: DUF4910 domain-containing protein [Candidatus Thorarchaeota archaeon]